MNPDRTVLIAEDDDGHAALIEKIFDRRGWKSSVIVCEMGRKPWSTS